MKKAPSPEHFRKSGGASNAPITARYFWMKPQTFENLNFGQPEKPSELRQDSEGTDNLDEVVSQHIRRVLSRTEGKVNGPDGAAAFLGINPSTLRNRMKKLGIDYGRKAKS